MQAWICMCVLLIQAYAMPHEGMNMRARLGGAAPMPASYHAPQLAFPPAEAEPMYPPAAYPGSLLSMEEQAGVGMAQEQIPTFDTMLPGYVPTSTPFDNPTSSLATLVAPIPATPDCSVRPQTVVEIQRMRESASKIAAMMQQETLIMNKRKTYVEQMTVYLNDRIMELNKVKRELAQETRWLDLSSNRIFELEEKEKLIKLQDIQSCLNDQTSRATTETTNVGKTLADIQAQRTTVEASIASIQARMAAINAGGASGGAGGAEASTA